MNFKNLLYIVQILMLVALGQVQAADIVITYYHNDALGSPVAATDEFGRLLWREEYRPYGERLRNSLRAATNRLWYTGKAHDEATGLTYFGARYYDPVIGRFMGVDPAGFDEANSQSFSKFAYANNNPYRYTDPDGKNPLLAVAIVAGLVALDIGIDTVLAPDVAFDSGVAQPVNVLPGPVSGASLAGGIAVSGGRSLARAGAAQIARGAAEQTLVGTLQTRVLQMIKSGQLIGANPQNFRVLSGPRLRGFTLSTRLRPEDKAQRKRCSAPQ